MLRWVLPAALACAPTAGCGGKDGDGSGGTSFKTVEAGAESFFPTNPAVPAETLLFRTQADWEAFWNVHKQGAPSFAPAPFFNFAIQTVVAVVTGTRPTTGYAVRIDRAEPAGLTVALTVTESTPGSGCGTELVLTRPFHIILLDQIVTTVSMRSYTVETVDCPR